MVFSDTTNNNGLIQDCERMVFGSYGAITNNTSRLKEFTALLNQALDETATDIMEVDRNWKWDDRNHGDLPIATTDLVNGQRDYLTETAFLKIQKVEVLDESGNETVLKSIHEIEKPYALDELFEQDTIPRYYDLNGGSIQLFPAPDYDKTDGLTIHYQRTFDHFTTSDTTQSPGCPTIFHPLISMRAAYKHAFVNRLAIAGDLEKEIAKYVEKLRKFMPSRNPWGRNKFLPACKSSK